MEVTMIISQTVNAVFVLSLRTKPQSPKASLSKQEKVTSSEFGVLLQSCIDHRSLKQGRQLHTLIREAGFERNRDLLPKLLKLYCTCGRVDYARELFDGIPERNLDTIAWTAMISGYVRCGESNQALALFFEMFGLGLEPDSYTFSALLKASADLSLHRLSTCLHSLIVKFGCGSVLSVGNALIHAYSSLGDACSAQKLFSRMPDRDIVSWSSMIQACTLAKFFAESVTLFSKMQLEEHIKPNEITLVSLLPACSYFSSLGRGQSVHAYAIRNGFDSNLIVSSALVAMYSKCGDPEAALKVFNRLERINIIVWTSMIEGFSINGRFQLALKLFELMQDQGMKPNSVTLVVILSACSHGGLIDEGLEIFEGMQEKFGIEPSTEHHACVVDMLGRGGRLKEAQIFIEKMKIPPTGCVLGSLLGACQVHRNVRLGERLANQLFQLEPYNESNYVILSNIYASVGRWDDVGRVRRLMVLKGLTKPIGCSWIELKGKVHLFGAHDRSHPESQRIYSKLEDLSHMIVKAGYVPSTKYILLDVEQEDDKKRLLCSHSERLAVAFGLLKAPPDVPLRIAKNLRVCGDCHDAIKLISKVVARRFIVRDTCRFHHFSQGSCSCGGDLLWMMMQRASGPRWKGKGFADIAAENPMSEIVNKLESSLKESRTKAMLSGSVALLEATPELADLLNRTCFGRQISNSEEDKHWFQLSSEETMYMQHALQCLVVVGENGRPLEELELWNVMKDGREAFPELFKSYAHLRGKNWVVRSGAQYGVDFVAYRHHPALVHSEYAVVVLSEGDGNGEKCSRLKVWSDVQCSVRLSGSVAKKLLVFSIDRKGTDATLPSCIQRFHVEELTITRWLPEQSREACLKNDDGCESENIPAT